MISFRMSLAVSFFFCEREFGAPEDGTVAIRTSSESRSLVKFDEISGMNCDEPLFFKKATSHQRTR